MNFEKKPNESEEEPSIIDLAEEEGEGIQEAMKENLEEENEEQQPAIFD